MKISKLAGLALLVGTTVFAQQQPQQQSAQAAAPTVVPVPDQIVAVINGETISRSRLEVLYAALGTKLRAQYDQTGGKQAFLDNYIGKRLLIQEALKTGFDKRPQVQMEMEAAKESALFDLWVREVVGREYVTDAEVRKYYDENPEPFVLPERTHVRHIVITSADAGPRRKTKNEARELITKVFSELAPFRPKPGATEAEVKVFSNRFAEAARKYSEDGVAEEGGDLGWVHKGIDLDETFATAVYGIQRGAMSGVVETKFGYHIIFIEDKQPAGKEPFENVRPMLREYLMTKLMAERSADVMATVARLTNELRQSSKVAIYPENLK